MGRQINFYLTDSDQEAIVSDLVNTFGIEAIVPPCHEEPRFGVNAMEIVRWKMGEHNPVIFKKDDFPKLRYRFVGGVVNGFFVDTDTSPVIEFFRCVTFGNEISRGRFYYIAKFYDEAGNLVEKSPEFIAFAKRAFNTVKKCTTRNVAGDYVGQEAGKKNYIFV
jgi:hypothetical protein